MLAGALGALAAVVARFPFRWLRAFGAALGWLAGSVLRIRRAHVEAAMARAGLASPARHARAMYRALGASVFELLWLAKRRRRALDAIVALDASSQARWDEARAGKRGIVLAASHSGNWELAAAAIAAQMDLLVVAKRQHVGGFDRFVRAAREACGIASSDPEGALARGRAVLGRGGAVAMMIDQVPGVARHGIVVDFLGAPALADRAPATLAARAGAPLVVAVSRRTESGAHALHVLDVLVPPPRAGRAWIDAATRAATRALDAFVRDRPSEWLWMHRRWKRPRVTSACARCPPTFPSARSPGTASSAGAPLRARPSARTPSPG